MKKLVLMLFALIVGATSQAEHHNNVLVSLTLWNNSPFTIFVDGFNYGCTDYFEADLRPGNHFVKIIKHNQYANGGNVRVIYKGNIHVRNTGILDGIVYPNRGIEWAATCHNYNYGYDVFMRRMRNCYTDQQRYDLAIQWSINQRLSALQFQNIMLQFRVDNFRYRFAQQRYLQCYEPQYFYRCTNTFRNQRYRNNFYTYTTNRGHHRYTNRAYRGTYNNYGNRGYNRQSQNGYRRHANTNKGQANGNQSYRGTKENGNVGNKGNQGNKGNKGKRPSVKHGGRGHAGSGNKGGGRHH